MEGGKSPGAELVQAIDCQEVDKRASVETKKVQVIDCRVADKTEVEMVRGLSSKVVRRNLAAELLQMTDCWKVDRRVWVEALQDPGSMGARRCLVTELAQMIDCQAAGMRTEVELVQGLQSKVAGKMFEANQRIDCQVADKKASVEPVPGLDSEEAGRKVGAALVQMTGCLAADKKFEVQDQD